MLWTLSVTAFDYMADKKEAENKVKRLKYSTEKFGRNRCENHDMGLVTKENTRAKGNLKNVKNSDVKNKLKVPEVV